MNKIVEKMTSKSVIAMAATLFMPFLTKKSTIGVNTIAKMVE
jgi:hypothetical protein